MSFCIRSFTFPFSNALHSTLRSQSSNMMFIERLGCVYCSSHCEVNLGLCNCGQCKATEAAFFAHGWMDWKGKMYCGSCIQKWGWRQRAEEKAARHLDHQLEDLCPRVVEGASLMTRRCVSEPLTPVVVATLTPASKASPTTMTTSTNFLHVDEMMKEMAALREIVETLTARMDTLEEVKRQKRM